MHGKSLDVIRRIFGPEVIKQQERVKIVQGCGGDTALEPDAGTLHNGLGLYNLYHFSWLGIHSCLQWDSWHITLL
jgi:hypothetical protein